MKPKAIRAGSARQRILDDHREIAALTAAIAVTGDAKVMAVTLGRLQPLLQRHFREEEELDGLHATICERTPERETVVADLRREHAELLAMVQQIATLAGGHATIAELQRLSKVLEHRLKTHEAHENEAFLDSIWNDLGVGD